MFERPITPMDHQIEQHRADNEYFASRQRRASTRANQIGFDRRNANTRFCEFPGPGVLQEKI